MSKQYRNLSGIYFTEEIDGKKELICFEELSKASQDRIISLSKPEFVSNLAKMLGDVIIKLGNQFNIHIKH